MLDVLTMGETMALLSSTEIGKMRYAETMKRSMGGAETNVAIGLSRLGKKAGWISALGCDELGKYISQEVLSEGVDISHVRFDPEHRTGLMLKEFLPGRKSKVYYYRENSAASHLTADMLDADYIRQARLVHVTGITMALSESCAQAVSRLIDIAHENGVTVSFDPNIRLRLWSREKAAETIRPILNKVDILFTGEDESEILLGKGTKNSYLEAYLSCGIQIVALKNGKEGSIVADQINRHVIPIYDVPEVVDTVGAGDAYTAGFLYGYLEGKDIRTCGELGSILGGLVTQTYDDYRSLPDLSELQVILGQENEILR